ncbi:alpha/beta fold hydrolase [Ekhidna sp.]|uniref:alpha/beta fold hydrolase n=1 Tax=Ekhidna sp. TaxID=2608089 RepID=UPI003BAA20BB
MKTLNYKILRAKKSKKWIVFLHGAGGSIQTWKYQLSALGDDYNLLAIDLRDHGSSKNIKPAYGSYNFDIITEDVFEVLDKEGIEKAHFVTLSFGSVLIQALYERTPSIVDKMVIIGGIFNANWLIKSFVHLGRFFNLFLPYHTMYRLFSFILMPRERNQLARRVYQMQARKLTQSEFLKWLGLYSEFFTLLRNFSKQKIKQQILILMGSDDYVFLPSAQKFANGRSNTNLMTIPKAGHICNIEEPELVNKEIMEFLDTRKEIVGKSQSKVLFGTN